MKMKTYLTKSLITSIALLSGVLSGCSYDSENSSAVIDTEMMPKIEENIATFRVMVKNLSANQPFSPLAIVSHTSNYSAWSIGSAASDGLERLAEGGDNTAFIMEAKSLSASTFSGDAPIVPGSSDMAEIQIDLDTQGQLTVVTMLVNTNDAYTGATGISIAELAAGESITQRLPIYDAGTEANSESVGTIPGPADGGEGFDSVRDDADFVARHSGVVSSVDGDSVSILNSTHRFDSPIAELVITRL